MLHNQKFYSYSLIISIDWDTGHLNVQNLNEKAKFHGLTLA